MFRGTLIEEATGIQEASCSNIIDRGLKTETVREQGVEKRSYLELRLETPKYSKPDP